MMVNADFSILFYKNISKLWKRKRISVEVVDLEVCQINLISKMFRKIFLLDNMSPTSLRKASLCKRRRQAIAGIQISFYEKVENNLKGSCKSNRND